MTGGGGQEVSRQLFDDLTLPNGERVEGSAAGQAWDYGARLRAAIGERGVLGIFAVEVTQISRHEWAAILWRMNGAPE